jgi:hypothetical protein
LAGATASAGQFVSLGGAGITNFGTVGSGGITNFGIAGMVGSTGILGTGGIGGRTNFGTLPDVPESGLVVTAEGSLGIWICGTIGFGSGGIAMLGLDEGCDDDAANAADPRARLATTNTTIFVRMTVLQCYTRQPHSTELQSARPTSHACISLIEIYRRAVAAVI